MPIIYKEDINGVTKIGVWHITEPEVFFSDRVPLQRTITHPHKRLQHLAGRYLLKELFPEFPTELIVIADTKKPFLANEAFHFSISHCGDYAAVIVSISSRAGIDIEIPQEKIERIAHKFLSDAEKEKLVRLHADKSLQFTIAWSIKEAVFKWYGLGKVDFIGHIHIEDIRQEVDGFIAQCIFSKEERMRLTVKSKTVEGNILSTVITDQQGR